MKDLLKKLWVQCLAYLSRLRVKVDVEDDAAPK